MDVLEDLCGRDALTALITGVDLPTEQPKNPTATHRGKHSSLLAASLALPWETLTLDEL